MLQYSMLGYLIAFCLSTLYSAGPHKMSMNVHNVVHWPSMLSKWGPAWNYSNFNPESLNGWICYGTGVMTAKADTRFIQAKTLYPGAKHTSDANLRSFCLQQLNLPQVYSPAEIKNLIFCLCSNTEKTQHDGRNWVIVDKSPSHLVQSETVSTYIRIQRPQCAEHLLRSINRVRLFGRLFWTRMYLKPQRTQGNFVCLDTLNEKLFFDILDFIYCSVCDKLFIHVAPIKWTFLEPCRSVFRVTKIQ